MIQKFEWNVALGLWNTQFFRYCSKLHINNLLVNKILWLNKYFIFSVDATAETGKLGRLVNHSRNGNLTTKIISINSIPHLVLIAKEDIEFGEEVCYDYGDRSKESLKYHPWLAS